MTKNPTGMTIKLLRQLDRAKQTRLRFIEPGEVVEDIDGIPIAMTPNVSNVGVLAAIQLAFSDVQHLIGEYETREQFATRFPNIQFIDTEGITHD